MNIEIINKNKITFYIDNETAKQSSLNYDETGSNCQKTKKLISFVLHLLRLNLNDIEFHDNETHVNVEQNQKCIKFTLTCNETDKYK